MKNMMGGAYCTCGDRRGFRQVLDEEICWKETTLMPVVGHRIRLKWIFKKWGKKAWTVLIWLRTWTGGVLLLVR